jgi:hypothetical protein
MLAQVDARAAMASEGLSLTAVPGYGALVSFGGYNGKYHNTVHVFKPGEHPTQRIGPGKHRLQCKLQKWRSRVWYRPRPAPASCCAVVLCGLRALPQAGL